MNECCLLAHGKTVPNMRKQNEGYPIPLSICVIQVIEQANCIEDAHHFVPLEWYLCWNSLKQWSDDLLDGVLQSPH